MFDLVTGPPESPWQASRPPTIGMFGLPRLYLAIIITKNSYVFLLIINDFYKKDLPASFYVATPRQLVCIHSKNILGMTGNTQYFTKNGVFGQTHNFWTTF